MPARLISASGLGKRARQSPISAKSLAARTVPERGRVYPAASSTAMLPVSPAASYISGRTIDAAGGWVYLKR
ncbi:hypothetical protein [Mycobacterium sp.]|uniref:hypothetical protein n=1 Tax=Mycobacterium sp. TaxID=1785 RepID=UPI003F952AE4